MTPISPASGDRRPSWRGALRALPVVVALSSVSALLVVVVGGGGYDSLPVELSTANIIGVCAWGGAVLIHRLSGGSISPLVAALIAAMPAALIGLSLGGAVVNHRPLDWWLQDSAHGWRPVATALLLTFAAVAFAMRSHAASEYRAGLEAQRRQVAEARQGEALARLALLQAQIEPHFLFNTLANVQSMIERDPRTAARMLEHLNRYLRASLGRTRAPSSTCAEEMELIGALLAIAEIRLGGRLRYRIDLPESLREVRLPPLLLQPLVENALRHGIEPAVGGGEVEVRAAAHEGALLLSVRDTGLGFPEGAPAGVGLANVRARLASLYGGRGHLVLSRSEPRGTLAEITLPLQGSPASPPP